MNIVLIGYRCSGKSVVGKVLADYLDLKLVDTDQILESRVHCAISEYVAENGWEAFRMVEKMVIRSISSEDRRIIATGGGVVLDWENVRNLRQGGRVVWLQADISTIRDRMKQDEHSGKGRPGLMGSDPMKEIESILSQRMSLYKRASDWTINTTGKSPDQVANEILTLVPEPLMNTHDSGQIHNNGQIIGAARTASLNP